jgi:hypothetical protein
MNPPVCVLVNVRSATCVIVVASLTESLAVFVSPPPLTVAMFVRLAAAVVATVTVSVIAE